MNNAQQVENLLSNWQTMGLTKAELAIKIAEACMGWPYVWGGAGQKCTPGYRRSYANRDSCPEDEARQIVNLCQVLNGKRGSCDGCKWYPDAWVRFFDCRGFSRWVLQQAGITIQGAGATSQWNTASNWTQKGDIKDIPQGQVCCVFMQNQKDHKTMEHTGLHIGGGIIIHCSGEVKIGKVTDRGWTHFAVPAGIEGETPVTRPTIRKGSRGEDVRYCQEQLIKRGYDVGKTGADGIFGNGTLAAVKNFQRDNGLSADGVVGPRTWEKLQDDPQPEPEPGTKLYTVTIHHLTEFQADALMERYPGSEKRAEGSEQ